MKKSPFVEETRIPQSRLFDEVVELLLRNIIRHFKKTLQEITLQVLLVLYVVRYHRKLFLQY